MKYRINRIALLTRMSEYEQNLQQRLNYLKHSLSCLMSLKDWKLFHKIAMDYNIYYMLLQDASIELNVKYLNCYIVVKKEIDEYIIDIQRNDM